MAEHVIYLPPGRYRVYLRISQDQSGKEVGVDRQKYDLQPSIDGNAGVEIVDWYVDPDVSATKENVVRDEFERLLRDLQPDERVLSWHSDRFIRTTRDLMRVLKTKALVHSLHAGHFDLSTPAGVAVAKTQIAWAEYEGQQKALRQKSSHQQRARTGKPFLGGARPFGYDKDTVNQTYVVREDEAIHIRFAYERLLAGDSLGSIARQLNGHGSKTSKGRAWTPSSVRQVLTRPRNAGLLSYNNEEMGKGNWTGIVPERTYRAAVRILNDPSRRTAGPRMGRGGIYHWLVGLACCQICDGPTRAMDRGGYLVYQCRAGHASARAQWLEDEVAAEIIAAAERPVDRLTARMEQGALVALDEEWSALHDELEDLESAKKANEITLRQFIEFKTPVEARLKQVELIRDRQEVGDDWAEFRAAEDHALYWYELDVQRKARIARQWIDRVEIMPRGKGGGRFKTGLAQIFIKGEATARPL